MKIPRLLFVALLMIDRSWAGKLPNKRVNLEDIERETLYNERTAKSNLNTGEIPPAPPAGTYYARGIQGPASYYAPQVYEHEQDLTAARATLSQPTIGGGSPIASYLQPQPQYVYVQATGLGGNRDVPSAIGAQQGQIPYILGVAHSYQTASPAPPIPASSPAPLPPTAVQTISLGETGNNFYPSSTTRPFLEYSAPTAVVPLNARQPPIPLLPQQATYEVEKQHLLGPFTFESFYNPISVAPQQPFYHGYGGYQYNKPLIPFPDPVLQHGYSGIGGGLNLAAAKAIRHGFYQNDQFHRPNLGHVAGYNTIAYSVPYEQIPTKRQTGKKS